MNELIRDVMTPYFDKIIRKIELLDDRISNIETRIDVIHYKIDNNSKQQSYSQVAISPYIDIENFIGADVSEKPMHAHCKAMQSGEKCFIIESDNVKCNPHNLKHYILKHNEHKFIPAIFLDRRFIKLDEKGRGIKESFTVKRLDNNVEMTFIEYEYYFKIEKQ